MRKQSILTFILGIIFYLMVGCNSGGDDFGMLDDGSGGSSATDANDPITILSYTPLSDPVVVTTGSDTTFGITINATAGSSVTYEYLLDGTTLQNSTSPYYSLAGADVSGGSHVLKVIATNDVSTASHSFTVTKNAEPTVAASTPAATGNNVACGGGDITFDVTGADSDGDTLTFSWTADSADVPSMFTVTTVGNNSEAVFAPSCALSGLVDIKVAINDGHDTTNYSWLVTVANPTVAVINSYTPLTDPVVIASTASQLFSISAEGKVPLVYSWFLDGVEIGGAISSFYTLAAGSVTAGLHTLKAKVEDVDSFDEYTFNIKKNAPPSITSFSPSSSSLAKNVGTLFTYSIDVVDANSDALTYVWTVDGSVHPDFNHVETNGDLTSTASGTAADANLGDHTITVVVSDGVETTTKSWALNINKFSDACNALDAGDICTFVGTPGLGNDQDPSGPTTYPITMSPMDVKSDGSGNLFISDYELGVIWFYNRSGSTVSRVGSSIPANTAKIIAGVGMPSFKSADGNTGTEIPFYYPVGIAYDAARDNLFIANYNRDRVILIDNNGLEKWICSGSGTNDSARHPDGGNVTDQACDNPTGLAYNSTDKKLYVTSLNDDYVKEYDLTDNDPANWTGRLLIGEQNGSGAVLSGNEDGTINSGLGVAGDARIDGPWALDLDSAGNLYIATYYGCRIHAVNLSGAPLNLFGGAVSIPSDEVKMFWNSGCGQDSTTAPTALASMNLDHPRGIKVWEDGGIKGFFFTNSNRHRVIFLNNTAGDITIGNHTVPSYESYNVFGNGNADYNGDGGAGYISYLYYPFGLELIGNTLFVADYNNGRIRSLDISIDDGAVGSVIGTYQMDQYLGDDPTYGVLETRMRHPRFLTYDSSSDGLVYADYGNGRIRKVSLTTGLVSTLVGTGWGYDDGNDDNPSNMQLYYLTGLFMDGDNIIFSEGITNTGINRNCSIKYYNTSGSAVTQSNITIPAERVSTIGGSFPLGCANWDDAWDGDDAISTTLRQPSGVVKSQTDIIFSNDANHCLMKIASDGTISKYLGECGTYGDADGAIGAANVRLRNPRGITIDPQYEADGNMFLVDVYRPTGKIKYINRSVSDITIFGTVCVAGEITTITATGGYSIGVAAFDNQICYTSGYEGYGYYGGNTVCKNRHDPLGATTMRAGAQDGTQGGAGALGIEQENIPAYNSTLASPWGLTFDADGNLYISEYRAHKIRKVKRWW